MKLQTIEIEGKTYALVQDGKPLYKGDDGADVAFDAAGTAATIARITEESKGFKTRAQAAEDGLKKFEGIADPAKAIAALATVANLDQSKLVEAGKVEEIKAAAIQAVEEKYKPVVTERDALKGQLDGHIRGSAFANSKFVQEKVAVPRHMLERTYGENFKIEDGKLVPYDAAGNRLFSRARPGEMPDFDEAIELLIAADPFKDHILKGSGASGGGAKDGAGGGGAKAMSRAEFSKLSPSDQMAKMRDGFTLTE